MPSPDWEIVLPKERLQDLRVSSDLALLLTLCRAANAISLARAPLTRPWSWQSPLALRERFSALFYAGGVLTEALQVAHRLSGAFATLQVDKSGFARLLADPRLNAFRTSKLKKLRHKATFHFDRKFFADGLKALPDDDHVVAILRSARVRDVYYTLPDDIAFQEVMGRAGSLEEMASRFEEFGLTTVEIMNRFLQETHTFVPRALRSLGCRRRRRVVA